MTETAPPESRLEPPRAEGLDVVKRALVGAPMPSHAMKETLLRKTLALPIFASDALSSVAYATEAALIVLIGTSVASAHLIVPVSAAVSLLLAIVVLSYRQTVRAYSTSGGSYVVSRENLGTIPSLVAGAALLTDYVLTVAVSVAAGVLAIVSAFPGLDHLTVELSIGAVVLITLVNLRGVRESGVAFAIPTYAFILAMLALVLTGVARCTVGTCPTAVVPDQLPVGTGAITAFALLRAFASGSSALTGVEAISNGVSAFRHPQARNAARTLALLAVIAITFFMGVSWLAYEMHALPSGSVSVVSQVARGTFPSGSTFGFMFWVVQITTFAILILAANTSFQGFPRLAAMLANDRFFPRQFGNLGDRLVFSNGIIVLSGLAVFLLWAYNANVDSLIHLYVIGVFTAFTLSQAGMVRYWNRKRGPGWKRSAAVNGVGAAATGVVTVIVVLTKFTQGAWLVIVAIPLLVLMFLGIHRHYRRFARRLRAGAAAIKASTTPMSTTLIAVDAIDDATERAVWYARQIASDRFKPIHVPGRGTDSAIHPRWLKWIDGGRPRLELIPASEGRVESVLEYVWSVPRHETDFVNVVVPETFRKRSLLEAFRKTTTFQLKVRLLKEPGIVITDVPVVAGEAPIGTRAFARVLVSGVHGASLRAIAYAQTLELDDVRAVCFAFDAEEARAIRRDWERYDVRLPLDVVEAPFRDLGDPLLHYLRPLTADGSVAVVVMPELVVHGWRRLLHNQRALYLKRLLLFEPRVILSSVPYRVG